MPTKKTTKKDSKNLRVPPKGFTTEEMRAYDAKEAEKAKFSFDTLYQALFVFQQECPTIPRNGTGKTSDGREYKYATLDDVLNITRPVLSKVGLLITQPMSGNELVTTLVHVKSGEEKVSSLPLGAPERSQDLGSRITYLRRYQIAALLGLSIEPDADARPNTGLGQPVAPKLPTGGAIPAPQQPNIPSNQPQVLAGGNTDMATAQSNTAQPDPTTAPVSTRSESFKKANVAIDGCMGLEALALIRGNIGKSQKLNDDEKGDLITILESKQHKLEVGDVPF